MKGNILKTILVAIMIACLVLANFLFVGVNFVYALENLDAQSTNLNDHVNFDVYLNESKNHELDCKIKEGGNLFINLNVTSGSLDGSKISLENANFKLGKIENIFVKNVDYDNNVIELNDIQYGNNVTIEVPISFEKQNEIDADYFNRITKFNLEGNYTNNSGNVSETKGSIETRVTWSEEADTTLSTNIGKYVEINNGKYILQEEVVVAVNENELPKQEEKITVNTDINLDKDSCSVVVLKNGDKLPEEKYEVKDSTVTITTANETKDGKVVWGSGKDVYKIIYVFESENKLNKFTSNITSETKFYGKANKVEKEDEKNNQEQEISVKGDVVSNVIESTKEAYKGYIYYGKKNETLYTQNYNVEISNIENVENITLKSNGDAFILDNNSQIDTNGKTYFKTLTVSKENLVDILGEDGNITLSHGDTQIVVNKDTQANDNGEIVINNTNDNGEVEDLKYKNIKLTTTKPVKEGTLRIVASKAISGNTEYDKETLKNIKAIESTIIVDGKETKTQTKLLDTINPIAKVKMEDNSISTLNPESNDVKIYALLAAISNKYDLYKNPEITVILPKEVESFEFSHDELYSNGLTLKNNPELVKNEDGTSSIKFVFEGEQANFGNKVAEGLVIGINGKIVVNKLTPSTKTQIKMTYTNENKSDEVYETTTDLNINSKEGILTYTEVSGIEEQAIETISDETVLGNLPMNAETKKANVNMAVVNNYDRAISDVNIIGKLDTSFDATLASAVEVKNVEGAKVVYSTNINEEIDSQNWTESFEGAKAYKVTFTNDELPNGQVVEFGYSFNVPEGLKYNEVADPSFELNYTYAGGNNKSVSAVSLKTEEKEETKAENKNTQENTNEQNVQERNTKNVLRRADVPQADETTQVITLAEGVTASIRAVTDDNRYLANNDSVKEGSTIKYTVTVTNNSGNTIDDLRLKFENTNVKYYGNVTVPMASNEFAEDGSGKIVIDTNWYQINDEETSKTFPINNLENGESMTYLYEVQVKDGVQNVEGAISIVGSSENPIEMNGYNVENGDIALNLYKNNYVEFPYTVNYPETIKVDVKNISQQTISNREVNIPLNGQISILEVTDENEEAVNYIVENDILCIKNLTLNSDEMKSLYVTFVINPFEDKHIDLILIANMNNENDNYYSNALIEGVDFEQTKLTIEQIKDEKETLEKEEEFNVRLSIRNDSDFTDRILISQKLPDVVELIRIKKNGEQKEIPSDISMLYCDDELNAGESEEYIFTFKVKKNISDILSFKFNFAINGKSKVYQTDDIQYMLNNDYYADNQDESENQGNSDPNKKETSDQDEDTNDNQNDNSNENGNNNGNNNNSQKQDENNEIDKDNEESKNSNNGFSISGTVWIDKNKDGKLSNKENKMSNVFVYLFDSENENLITVQTSEEGKYEFKGLKEGKFIVAFGFDSNKYRTTDYKKKDVEEEYNSDVIEKTLDLGAEEQIYAVTDILDVDKDIKGVNAGFVEKEKFDLKLDKYVSKIIVQNNAGTKINNYENTKLAKIEIHRKNIINSTVIIEYKMKITNEGELAGYVGDIVDFVPNDLTFSSEINKDWYKGTDGYLHNTALSNKLIEPGKSKNVVLTLTKTMTNNNIGTTINTAEIAKASNELSIEDNDSKPNNRVENEDDFGKAEVIISVSTGSELFISIFVIASILIVPCIVFCIKRRGEKNEK